MQAELNRITQIRNDARNSQPVSSPEKRLVPPYRWSEAVADRFMPIDVSPGVFVLTDGRI